jgi:UDP-N-acetylglucosamine 2-epimerase (non-hydrolysing)
VSCAKQFHLPVILPLHPRTRKNLCNFAIVVPDEVRVIEPVGYLDFLQLEANAALLLTDSGGVQEEACILHVPCVTLRDSTERPETVMVGGNILVGADPKRILDGAKKMFGQDRGWTCPLGDGSAAERILDIVLSY